LCYLLFKKSNGQYLITGESENDIDKSKNVKLDLGEVDDGSNDAIGYIILMLVLGGVAYGLMRYRKRKQQSIFDDTYVPATKPFKAASSNNFKSTQSSTKQKGDAFEKFIIERFKKPFFTLLEWRSDKMHNGFMHSPTCSRIWSIYLSQVMQKVSLLLNVNGGLHLLLAKFSGQKITSWITTENFQQKET
jgi:hypothetical protein